MQGFAQQARGPAFRNSVEHDAHSVIARRLCRSQLVGTLVRCDLHKMDGLGMHGSTPWKMHDMFRRSRTFRATTVRSCHKMSKYRRGTLRCSIRVLDEAPPGLARRGTSPAVQIWSATGFDRELRHVGTFQIAALVFNDGASRSFPAIMLTPLRDQTAFYMAPRLQMRYWRRRGVDHDAISI